MLALPHAFASGGMVPGIITVLVCGSTGWFGLYILSRCGEKTDHRALSFTALSVSSRVVLIDDSGTDRPPNSTSRTPS